MAETISDNIWDLTDTDFATPNSKNLYKQFREHIEGFPPSINKNSHFILPLGILYDNNITMSLLYNSKLKKKLFPHDNDSEIHKTRSLIADLYDHLMDSIEYIYIPREINPQDFITFENEHIQSLMDINLNKALQHFVTDEIVLTINNGLDNFIYILNSGLEDYSFQPGKERKISLRKHDLNKLITEAYLRKCRLNKKTGKDKKGKDRYVEISKLSAGEKQKALIDIIYILLKNYRNDSRNLILSIDEPEASLHISACYDQFDKLNEISSMGRQCIFTTHWYGFIPTIEKGSITCIDRKEAVHTCDLLPLANYREWTKQHSIKAKGKRQLDINIKSISDLVQSIVYTISMENPYTWLICEGSTERVYFSQYLKEVKAEKRVCFVPAGGVTEVVRIFNLLKPIFLEYKKYTKITGKAIFLIDTDENKVDVNDSGLDDHNILFLRLASKGTEVVLVNAADFHTGAPTAIEYGLNGELFRKTLETFRLEDNDVVPILDEAENFIRSKSLHPYFHLTITGITQQKLWAFFQKSGIKYEFAKRYTEALDDSYAVPAWIEELKSKF